LKTNCKCPSDIVNLKFIIHLKFYSLRYVNLGVYDQYCPPSICKLVEEYNVTENYTYNINGVQSDIGLLRLDRPVQYKGEKLH